jgi:hypothetical protein
MIGMGAGIVAERYGAAPTRKRPTLNARHIVSYRI